MKNLNSVAFVAKIGSINPIPGADNIEQAIIGGWSCVIKKGSNSVGDLVICATTDAVIPESLSEAMGVTSYLRSGTRVRTVKLRGVYSECLIIPLHYLNGKLTIGNAHVSDGDDVMEILGITKWEPAPKQIQMSSGKVVKYTANQNFKVYYKFPNIKNVKGMFTEEDEVQMTRKIHGTNARYGIVRKNKITLWDRIRKLFGNEWAYYEWVVGSHNVEKGSDTQGFYDTNVWYKIADDYNIKASMWYYAKSMIGLRNIGSGVVLYGEIYGAGIQKNYEYGLKEIRFAAFDLTVNGFYLPTQHALDEIVISIGVPHVPVLYTGFWSQQIQDKYTLNNFIDGTKIPHEGIVVKHITGDRRKVAKVINPDYLIHSEKHDVGDSH